MPDGSRSFDPVEAPELRRIAELYREHHAFVWRVLRRCGVPEADLDDAVQDTFLVMVRRLDDFDGRAAITTWLYAIAVRVASTRRRSRRREDARRRTAGAGVHGLSVVDPEGELSRVEAARVLDELLDELDDGKRTVFVLAELEGVRVPEISRILGVNVRTIHSRLRLARERFGAALKRRHARDEGRTERARWAARRLAAAADEPPPPARRKAVAAALIVNLERGAAPALQGWETIGIAAPAPFVVPLVATLALGGAALGVAAVAVGPREGARDGDAAIDRAEAAAHGRAGVDAEMPSVRETAPAADDPQISAQVVEAPIETPATLAADGRRAKAPTPRAAAAPSPSAPSKPSLAEASSTLAEETALLQAARTALTEGDAAAALRALDRYDARFPGGELTTEAKSTRLRALCRAGRHDEARTLATKWNDARWSTIVAAACDG